MSAAATLVAPLRDVDAELPQPRRLLAIASVLAVTMLVVLDTSIANVALPTIAQSLQVEPAVSVRVVTAYQIALVMALLPCAALGESLGYRRVFVFGVALFVGASALCAAAPDLTWLCAARFAQGLGGACVMSLGVALLRFTVPQHRLGAAIGWNAMTVALTSAAGPTIGALILSNADWRWLFAVNIPLGAAVLLAMRALPRVAGTARALDLKSAALNAGAFAALFLAAEAVVSQPGFAVAGFAVAGALLAALIRRERRRRAPLIPLDLLRSDSFRLSVLASICCFTGQSIALIALPFYLQHEFALDPLTTGLLITPWPLATAIAAPIAGRLCNRWSTGVLCAIGGLGFALGLAGAAIVPSATGNAALLVPFIALCGAGFGFFQTPNNRNMFLSAPRERSGAAGGMQGTARLLGQTSGAVIVSLMLAALPLQVAPRLGFGLAAVLAATAGLVSLRRLGRD